MPMIGEKITDVELDAFQVNEIRRIKLSDYLGKWLVLLFYPADFTFVCPTELEDAADNYRSFKDIDCELMSVSTDTAFTHKAWHEASSAVGKVTFPMLADPTGNLCRAFGTYLEDEGLSLRGTFIVNPDGVLISQEIHDNSIGRNINEILRKVQAAKHVRENEGEVCPARWEPGKKTLKPKFDLIGKI